MTITKWTLHLLFFFIIIIIACDVEKSPSDTTESSNPNNPVDPCIGGGNAPTVTTRLIAGNPILDIYIAGTSAIGGGNVTSEGDYSVKERGICWGTSLNPTINDNKTGDGKGFGPYGTAKMTYLIQNTEYHVRAYATNDCGTTSYGNDIIFNSGFAFGTEHEGGYVFYNNGYGEGLVAAKSDLRSSGEWIVGGNTQNTKNNNTKLAIGTGLANSLAIVSQSGHIDSAAKICLDYSSQYSDWYLPSRIELELMYTNLRVLGFGNFSSGPYWSSSEYNTWDAWYVRFNYKIDYIDNPYADRKYSTNMYVRAIRNF